MGNLRGNDSTRSRVRVQYSGDQLVAAVTMIVEGWDKRTFGRGQRAWRAQFTEAERNYITGKYPTYCGWVLRSGMPEWVTLSPTNHALLWRAADFFATI